MPPCDSLSSTATTRLSMLQSIWMSLIHSTQLKMLQSSLTPSFSSTQKTEMCCEMEWSRVRLRSSLATLEGGEFLPAAPSASSDWRRGVATESATCAGHTPPSLGGAVSTPAASGSPVERSNSCAGGPQRSRGTFQPGGSV